MVVGQHRRGRSSASRPAGCSRSLHSGAAGRGRPVVERMATSKEAIRAFLSLVTENVDAWYNVLGNPKSGRRGPCLAPPTGRGERRVRTAAGGEGSRLPRL